MEEKWRPIIPQWLAWVCLTLVAFNGSLYWVGRLFPPKPPTPIVPRAPDAALQVGDRHSRGLVPMFMSRMEKGAPCYMDWGNDFGGIQTLNGDVCEVLRRLYSWPTANQSDRDYSGDFDGKALLNAVGLPGK